MKRFFQRRRNRCLCCLVTALAVSAFLIWDAFRFEGRGTGIPGPGYLVLWLGMILVGLIAVTVFAVDVIRSGIRQRQLQALAPKPSPQASERKLRIEPEAPAAQLLPRA
ncbi:MAG: hypothetical protein KDN19_01410 [Verrucomicrobiae bacterium]|nr:hypothetical protein [Verrucomicrobiae bacterium]